MSDAEQLHCFNSSGERVYHDTTDAGSLLEQYKDLAARQDLAVLEYFDKKHCRTSSPSQVHDWLIRHGMIDAATPLTSIRRSMTNLTRRGFLYKTETKTIGGYGRQEFCWRRR